ncbi:MAG: SpoIID/LytB domain-containing protein [Candidatus Desulforudis sp.]|nr:SpoIID/LytB domain-containing protein [Desulforudis sp.]
MLRRMLALGVLLVVAVVLVGCPPGAQRRPAIPQEISQGENKEPRLRVFVVEDEQIQEFAFEDYVAGVLAGEMQNTWPENALAAQAILARTFALKFINEKESRFEGANISTDIEEAQAWNAAEVNDRIREAVSRTRGQVLVHRNDFINSWFHAHAGGQTATAREGLNWKDREPPYIQSVESPDSPQAPPEAARWTATVSKQQVVQAVNQIGAQPGEFTSIEIVDRGPSGRAIQLQIGNATVNAADFRIAIGSTEMRSTKLTAVNVAGNQVTMAGEGFGHGVGMSQWGAYQMAQDGRSPEDIVRYYFRNVRVVQMWE